MTETAFLQIPKLVKLSNVHLVRYSFISHDESKTLHILFMLVRANEKYINLIRIQSVVHTYTIHFYSPLRTGVLFSVDLWDIT